MKTLQWKALMLCSAVWIAGCSSSSSSSDGANRPVLAAINAVSDMSGIAFLRVEELWSTLEFGEATTYRSVDADRYDLNFDAHLPGDEGPCVGKDADGDNACTRLATISLNALNDREYTVVLFGTCGDLDVLVYDKAPHVFADDDDRNAEVQFFHLAGTLAEVDVFIEPPGAILSPMQARATLSLKDSFEALINEGDYVLTLTAVADPSIALFTSETFRIDRRTRVAFSILDGAGQDTSQIRVAQSRDRGAMLLDRDRLTELRVTHVVPRLGDVDVYARGSFATPFVADLAFEETSAYQEINPNDLFRFDLDITPARNPGVFLSRERINLTRGERATFFILGTSDDVEGLKVSDGLRRLATHARLRTVNGARATFDFYVVPQSRNIATLSPTWSLPFRNSAGLQRFAPGNNDIVVTTRGTKTVVFGPLVVGLSAGSIYTIIATDTGEATSADLVLLDDFQD